MTSAPEALVSVACPRCGERPDPNCPRCEGHGIVMLRVRADEATLSTEELRRRALRQR